MHAVWKRYIFTSFIFIASLRSEEVFTHWSRVIMRRVAESAATLTRKKKRKEKNLVYFAINSPFARRAESSERAARCDLCLVPALKVESGREMRLRAPCATILSRFADFCGNLWRGTTAAILPSRQIVEGGWRWQKWDTWFCRLKVVLMPAPELSNS